MEKMKVYAKLMAEQIPPLSSAAGGMRLVKFAISTDPNNPNQNDKFGFDLMNYRNTDLWPKKRPKKSDEQERLQRWLHGDYKDAPYLLTHPLYRKITVISKGNAQ